MKRIYIKPRFSIYHWHIGLTLQRLFEYNAEDLKAILERGATSNKLTGMALTINLLFFWVTFYFRRDPFKIHKEAQQAINKECNEEMAGFRESYGVEEDQGALIITNTFRGA